jgi:WD40 repeat protein
VVRRARLFMRRHRAPVAAAATVLVIMGIAAGVVMVVMVRGAAREQRFSERIEREREARRRAEAAMRAGAGAGPAEPARRPFRLVAQTGAVLSLAFSRDGNRLASGAEDHSVVLFDMATHEVVFTALVHEAPVPWLLFTADDRRLLSAARDGTIRFLDAGSGRPLPALARAPAWLCLALAPDGEALVLGAGDLTLRVLDLSPSRAQDLTLRGTHGGFAAAAFDAEGSRVAGATLRGSASVWDRWSGALVARLGGPEKRLIALAFVGADRLLAMSEDGAAIVWSLTEPVQSPLAFTTGAGPVVDVDVAGRWLLVGDERAVHLWDLQPQNPAKRGRLTTPWPLRAAAIAPDGAWCAMGGAAGEIAVEPLAAPGP